MSKWKNYGLWTSLLSLLGILVKIKYPNYLGNWTEFSTIVLGGFVAAGIISNPSDGQGYEDTKM